MSSSILYERLINFTRGAFQVQDATEVGETEDGDSFEPERVAESPTDRTEITVGMAHLCGYARVVLEVTDSRSAMDLHAWDHVVECSLHLPSGEIVIWTPKGSTVYDWSTREPESERIHVRPGMYRVLVLLGNLGATQARLRTGEIDYFYAPEMPPAEELLALDHYCLILWPVAVENLKVLKQFRA